MDPRIAAAVVAGLLARPLLDRAWKSLGGVVAALDAEIHRQLDPGDVAPDAFVWRLPHRREHSTRDGA